jgi:hypothetical protein
MLGNAKHLLNTSPTLPFRKGKRPVTICGPLHLQCSNHGDDRLLRHLIEDMVAWPDIEPNSLPAASPDLVSIRVAAEVPNDDLSVFIAGREFGRVHFGPPTIYLALPLSCAHWTIVRGWAEPHYSSSFGLLPPSVMVVYTPRDEQELAVCRWLFRISYHFALGERRRNSVEWALPCPGFSKNEQKQEAA